MTIHQFSDSNAGFDSLFLALAAVQARLELTQATPTSLCEIHVPVPKFYKSKTRNKISINHHLKFTG